MNNIVYEMLKIMGRFNVLPLYPPPKGEPCPINFSIRTKHQLSQINVKCSGQKIFDFFDSPFGGGQGGGFRWDNLISWFSKLFEIIKEISRFARNDGTCRSWREEGGGEAALFLPLTLINECHFERSEKSRSKAFYDLKSFTFMQLFFNSSSSWGRIQLVVNTYDFYK